MTTIKTDNSQVNLNLLAENKRLKSELEAMRKDEARLVKAMNDGYKYQYNEPASYLTDEANEKFSYSVERTKPPFCDLNGMRVWHGKTIYEALDSAYKAIDEAMKGE